MAVYGSTWRFNVCLQTLSPRPEPGSQIAEEKGCNSRPLAASHNFNISLPWRLHRVLTRARQIRMAVERLGRHRNAPRAVFIVYGASLRTDCPSHAKLTVTVVVETRRKKNLLAGTGRASSRMTKYYTHYCVSRAIRALQSGDRISSNPHPHTHMHAHARDLNKFSHGTRQGRPFLKQCHRTIHDPLQTSEGDTTRRCTGHDRRNPANF